MGQGEIESALLQLAKKYQESFAGKIYAFENDERDLLMDAFGITPELKRENRQYWGRELGMCWQLLVTRLCSMTSQNFQPGLKVGDDEPCDFRLGSDAVDTKYRVGSGDAGTLKKFRAYGKLLTDAGYRPVMLFVRSDNLQAAITACRAGGWTLLMESDSFEYIRINTGFDLRGWLVKVTASGELKVSRSKA